MGGGCPGRELQDTSLETLHVVTQSVNGGKLGISLNSGGRGPGFFLQQFLTILPEFFTKRITVLGDCIGRGGDDLHPGQPHLAKQLVEALGKIGFSLQTDAAPERRSLASWPMARRRNAHAGPVRRRSGVAENSLSTWMPSL